MCIRGKVFVAVNLAHRNSDPQRTVNLAVLHQVPPDNPLFVVTFVHIFGQVEPDSSEEVLVTASP